MLLVVAVFITDALISYLGWQRLDGWLIGHKARVLIVSLFMDIAIAVNTMAFVIDGWWMLIPSLVGSTLGTLIAMYYKSE